MDDATGTNGLGCASLAVAAVTCLATIIGASQQIRSLGAAAIDLLTQRTTPGIHKHVLLEAIEPTTPNTDTAHAVAASTAAITGHELVLINRCATDTISVSIHYLAGDGHWRTEGWWNLKPNDDENTHRITSNRIVYFYALAAGAESQSTGAPTFASLPIDKAEGYTAIDASYMSPTREVVKFNGWQYPELPSGVPYVHKFFCQ